MNNVKGGLPLSNPPPLQTDLEPPQPLRKNLPARKRLCVVSSSSPTTSREATAGFHLPAHLASKFWTPIHSPDFARGQADDDSIACWLAFLGWTNEQVLSAVEAREGDRGGLGRLGQGIWMGRESRVAMQMAFGRWRTTGRFATSFTEDIKQYVSVGYSPTGTPTLTRNHLAGYLADVQARHHEYSSTNGRRRDVGLTDRQVMSAAVKIALTANTLAPVLPLRRLAELVNRDKETVGCSIRRLEAGGFLLKQSFLLEDDNPAPRKAQAYLLRAPICQTPVSYLSAIDLSLCPGLIDNCPDFDTFSVAHPAFHAGALGPAAYEMLAALLWCPANDSEWLQATKLNRRTFQTLRRKVVEGGAFEPPLPALVTVEGGQPLLVPPDQLLASLDEIAAAYKTDEKVAKRKARHEHDRRNLGRLEISYKTNDPDRYEAVDQYTAIDKSTGEVVDIKTIKRTGEPTEAETRPGSEGPT